MGRARDRILKACGEVGYDPVKLEYLPAFAEWDGAVGGGWELDGMPIGANVDEAVEYVEDMGVDLYVSWSNMNGGARHPNDHYIPASEATQEEPW